MRQFIICPNCGAIELGTIDTTTIPWNTFIHHCSKCEYIIMESDWQTVPAIAIKQPWASLIVEDIKDIENRTWATKVRGRVLVYASAKNCKSFNFSYKQSMAMNGVIDDDTLFLNSAIVGSVEIVDCVINYPSIWAEKTDLNDLKARVIYNWVLANPIKFPEPIKTKGQLRFFTPKID